MSGYPSWPVRGEPTEEPSSSFLTLVDAFLRALLEDALPLVFPFELEVEAGVAARSSPSSALRFLGRPMGALAEYTHWMPSLLHRSQPPFSGRVPLHLSFRLRQASQAVRMMRPSLAASPCV